MAGPLTRAGRLCILALGEAAGERREWLVRTSSAP